MRCYESLIRHEGNSALFTALEISIVSTLAGRPLHVHAEGVRGTGKTTIMRAAAGILPEIERIAGCPHNCKPWAPHCPEHRTAKDASGCRKSEWVPMPFLEISHSAKLGTVVGSIDLSRIMAQARPEAALLLGTIPRANRGIIFTDEVNRLADTSPELTDVLLDAMGTKPGRVQIEESGLPVVTVPVELSVWAASNPDEDPGPLEDVRRQLSDRFDLSVEMGRTGQASVIRQILDFDDFMPSGGEVDDKHETPTDSPVLRRTAAAALLVPEVLIPNELLDCIASLYVDFDIESIRALEASRTAARCRAALTGRTCVSYADLRCVLPMVLRHRVDTAQFANILRYLDSMSERCIEPRQSGPVRSFAEICSQTGKGGADGAGCDGSHDAGFRAVLKGLIDRVRADQAIPPGAEGGAGGKGGPLLGGASSGQAPSGSEQVQAVCPKGLATPISQVQPCAVFGEEDLA